jgi:hypothetical protein
MKNIVFISCLIAFFFATDKLIAQAPQKISYQAVVRDASNNLVSSSTVGMQISILQGSASGTAVYVETHSPTSNSNGLVTIEIGNGSIVSGNFASINWANGPYFIKTETDVTGGINYTLSSTSQLMSVPYALYATRASITDSVAGGVNDADSDPTNELQTISVVGDTIFLSNGGGSAVLPTGNTGITHHIGQSFGGGIVFHVFLDSLGVEHGLIVSLNDLGFTEWGLYGTNVFSCESDWDGLSNSNAANAGTAIGLCNSYTHGGYSDWYLPSILELQKLYTNLFDVNLALEQTPAASKIITFSNSLNADYWSSTEIDLYNASFLDFNQGIVVRENLTGFCYKIINKNIRAIRRY